MFSYSKFSQALSGGSVPGAPTSVSATAGDGQATVTFTAPVNKGLPAVILDYQVTSSPGGITATGSASPITVTGLTNDTAYTFTVKARNATGYGPASAASNSVTPQFPIPSTVEVMIVAGGGAGGQFYGAGGGGGGVLRSNAAGIAITANTSYTVTVGAGGAYTGANGVGPRGSNSVFQSANANGGGGGGWNSANGSNGGSGGGKSGTSVQASYADYTKYGNNGSTSGSGGGGGATAAGSGRNGGDGYSSNIYSPPTYYAGGGAGEGGTSNGQGGGNYPNKGGGGRGDALTNLPYDSSLSAGSGGSGAVFITIYQKRPISNISAGLTYSTNHSGGFYRYQFTAGTGTIKWE